MRATDDFEMIVAPGMRLGCDRGHNGGARVNDAQKIRIARGRVWTCKIVAGGATSKGMGQMNRFFFFPFLIFCFVIVAAGMGFGQEGIGPEQGGHEVQVWAGGGHSVPGGTSQHRNFRCGPEVWMGDYGAASAGIFAGTI